jgi:hypothetical protein
MAVSWLSADDLRKLASDGAYVAGDALDDYAAVHQGVADVASQIPVVNAFVPLVNAIWEPLTGKAGTTAEQAKRDKAAAAKKAAAQANYVSPDVQNARAIAKSLARAAAAADAAANDADVKASSEADPNGPLHAAAKRAHDFARLQRISADAAQAKADAMASSIKSPTKTAATPPTVHHTTVPWRSVAIGAGVVVGGGILLALLFSRSK